MSLLDLWGQTDPNDSKYDSDDTDASEVWTPAHCWSSQHPGISFLDDEYDDGDEGNEDMAEGMNMC